MPAWPEPTHTRLAGEEDPASQIPQDRMEGKRTHPKRRGRGPGNRKSRGTPCNTEQTNTHQNKPRTKGGSTMAKPCRKPHMLSKFRTPKEKYKKIYEQRNSVFDQNCAPKFFQNHVTKFRPNRGSKFLPNHIPKFIPNRVSKFHPNHVPRFHPNRVTEIC